MLCLRESRKLASDGLYVHAGYAKRRKPLLQAGITLYEMRRRGRDLHTVSAGSVFDRELELGRLAALRGGGKLGLWLRELSKMVVRATNRRLSHKDVRNSEPL